jgi:hypothetical protein
MPNIYIIAHGKLEPPQAPPPPWRLTPLNTSIYSSLVDLAVGRSTAIDTTLIVLIISIPPPG